MESIVHLIEKVAILKLHHSRVALKYHNELNSTKKILISIKRAFASAIQCFLGSAIIQLQMTI